MSSINKKSAFQVCDYIYLNKIVSTQDEDNIDRFKKNKKKLIKKKKFIKNFNLSIKEFKDEKDKLNLLKEFLLKMKKDNNHQLNKVNKGIGVLFENNVIEYDITILPPIPNNYDILCLESNILEYDYTFCENIYWNKTKIKNSGNFVINFNSIGKIIDILFNVQTLDEFFNKINELELYSINQYQLSKRNTLELEFKNAYEISKSKIDIIKDDSLPKVSLICPFTSIELFFHTLITFLKLDYPKEKLELIIIDDTNSEKKMNLPEDKRIRLINLNKKSEDECISIGYKLNLGIKYSSNDIIFHLFDSNNYIISNFKRNIINFLYNQKDVLLSNNTGEYPHKISHIPDLANFIYLKKFWNVYSFEDTENNQIDLINKFLSHRTNCVRTLDFSKMSFKIKNNEMNDNLNEEIKMEELVDDTLKKSFNFIFEQINSHA